MVADERDDGVNQKPPAIVYWPMLIEDFWTIGVHVERAMSYVVRTERTGSPGFARKCRQRSGR